MKNRISRALVLGLAILLVVAYPVLAFTYYANIQCAESGGTSYSMVGLTATMNNSWLATNHYITASGLDTRVTTAGTALPHMLASDRTMFATPITANSVSNLKYETGNSAGSFYVIPGYGGSIAVADAANLELGSAFTIEQKGDTRTSTTGSFLSKFNAFNLYSDGVGNVVASIGQPPTALTQVIYGGSNDPTAAATTEYNCLMGGGNWNATESVNYQCMPTAGTISSLYVRLSANVSAGTVTLTVMKNGNPTAVTLTINTGASTGSDLTNSVAFAAGDTVSIRCVASGASGTPFAQWSTLWNSSIANESIFLLNATCVIANAVFVTPQGQGSIGHALATENRVQVPMPTDGTFSKFYVKLSADPGTAPDDYKFEPTKNGVAQSLTCTIVADNTTGNDTTHSFSVVAGDLIDISITPENVPAVAPTAAIGMVFSSTTSGESVVVGGDMTNQPSVGSTQYNFLCEVLPIAWNNTESNMYQLTQLTIISKFYVQLTTAPDNGAGVDAYTFNIMEAGGLTGLTVTLSEATTLWSDTTNTYTSVNGAVTSVQSTPSNTPASTYVHWGLVSRYIGVSRTVAAGEADNTITVSLAAGVFTLTVGANSSNIAGTPNVPNNNASLTIMSNAMPYMDYLKITTAIGGTSEKLKFQPATIVLGQTYSTGTATFTNGSDAVTGAGGAAWTSAMNGSLIKSNTDNIWHVVSSVTGATTLTLTAVYSGTGGAGHNYTMSPRLPDLDSADNDGAITWGANPGSLTSTIGALVSASQPSPSAVEPTPPQDIVPPAQVNMWGMVAPTNPLSPVITFISTNLLHVPDVTTWLIFEFLIVMMAVGIVYARFQNGTATGITGCIMVGACVAAGPLPWWVILIDVVVLIGLLIAGRSST